MMNDRTKLSAKRVCVLVSTMVGIAVLTGTAQAANTFAAVSGNDWNTAGNWSEGVPTATQDVVIDGDVTLTNATPAPLAAVLIIQ